MASSLSFTRAALALGGKNGAIVRKHMSYGHIPSHYADAIQRFYTAHFNVYLNYHRPCGFAQIHTDAQGRRQRHYATADYATPYERFRSLPESQRYLKEGRHWQQVGPDRLRRE